MKEKLIKKKNIKKTITHLSLAIIYFSIAMYILLPTIDELFIHPIFGFYFADILGFSFGTGAFISMVLYRLIGVIFLCMSLLLGGKIIKKKLEKKYRANIN